MRTTRMGLVIFIAAALRASWLGAALPTVVTTDIGEITTGSAACGGTVISDGGATVTTRGCCWSTVANPTVDSNKTIDGSGAGVFSSSLNSLSPGTIYYVKAYATNAEGTSYGAQKAFTTLTVLPTVSTTSVTDVTDSSAVSGGTVTSDGGSTVTSRGVCWSTSENPTTASSRSENGTGTGTYISAVTGLEKGTTYYVRAYAVNMAGVAYGEQRSFKTTSPLVTLTMAVSGEGATTPAPGAHVVASSQAVSIQATPAAHHHFVSWQLSGGGSLGDSAAPSTTVTLLADATVTALFTHDTASLSLTVVPTVAGSVTPAIGTHTVNTNESINLLASPAGGFYFTGWMWSGDANIANASAAATTIILTGDAIVVANFSATPPQTAAMTMAVSPAGTGSTQPEGTTSVSIAVPLVISATATEGYYFTGWKVFPTSNAMLADANAAATTVTLAGDATVTATFATSPTTLVTLTMALTPEAAGATTPAGGAHVISAGLPQSIVATPADGYFFVKWSATEKAAVAVPNAASTTVTLSDSATVTAEFSTSQTLYLALGSVVTVNAASMGDPLFLEFKAKPKIFAAKPTSKAIQMSLVDTASKQKPSKTLTAQWTKKLLLYDKQKFKEVKRSEVLLASPMTDMALGDLFAQTKELYNNMPIDLDKEPWLAAPIITDVSNSAGVIIVRGMYFGAAAPKIQVEYTRPNGKWYYKTCAVDKTATYKFKNCKGIANASCMKVLASDLGGQSVGYSEVMVTFPTLPPDAKLSGYIILDNSIALATAKLP